MKKTFPANICGKIYYIEEDAYNLLQNYFTQLRASFPGEEGAEIVGDIEGRVAEIFEDKITAGHAVITLEDANEVISRMGRPEELSDDGDEHSAAAGSADEPPFISVNLPGNKHLYRDTRNKVFGGVISGLAEYLNWNCNIMRLLLVVVALCSYVWPWIVVYLIVWMIIPPAGNSRQILEMQGRPVTVDGVGRTVLESTATPPPYSPEGRNSGGGFWSFVSQVLGMIGKCALILLLLVGSVVGISAVVFLIFSVTMLVLGLCYGNFVLASAFHLSTIPVLFSYQAWTMILASLVAVVPCIALVWGVSALLFNKRGASAAVIVSAVVVEVLLVAALVVMCHLVDGTSAMCMLSASSAAFAGMA